MEPRRIFLFAHTYPLPYKPYYDTQFADLVEKGHEVVIFAGRPNAHTLNERVRAYGLDRRVKHVPTTLRTLPRHARRVLQEVVQRPGDVFRAAAAVTRRVPRPRAALANVGRAVMVVGEGRPDFCLVHGLGTAVMYRWLKDVFPDVTVAMYYHGGEVPTVPDLEDDLAAATFDRFDVVFTNTEFSRRHAIERGCLPDRVQILPVGFWIGDFNPGEGRAYRRGGTLRLLSAGRMSQEKGHIFALRALHSLIERGIHDVHYAMTGEGYTRPGLEAYVREHGLEEHVSFLGQISTEELLAEMQKADVLLLPSIQVGNWVENQACAVQEAMLMKAVVVTSRTGGVPESIPEDMRPFSVPESDADALADVLARIYGMSAEEIERLGATGRSFVEGKYDIRRLNERMLSIIAAQTP